MGSENSVVETILAAAENQGKESEDASKKLVMKAILIKKGTYILSNSLVLPSFEVCLLGEEGTVLIPGPNVLPIVGVGNKDIKCSKCGYTLALTIKRSQLQRIAIKCPSCGFLNEL